MVLKICGMGFILNKGSYLREAWNVMDFIIVVTAYIPYVVGSAAFNLQALRSLRVLRPLRTISNIQALKVLVITLLGAFWPLLETIMILMFVLIVFAIGGLQLFSGVMKKRCFSVDEGIPLEDLLESMTNYEKFCISDDDCGTRDGVEYICGKMIANPNFSVTNFDTIFYSFLMAFQSVTLEGWSDIMLAVQNTFSPLAAIYFVFLIFIGSFFLLNLTLAVIKAEFTSQNSTVAEKQAIKSRTYDEKLFEKIQKQKHEVLKLIHKKKEGDITFDKYQIKGENLIAVTSNKSDKNKPKRRRKDKHKSVILTKLDRLKHSIQTVAQNLRRSPKKKQSACPEPSDNLKLENTQSASWGRLLPNAGILSLSLSLQLHSFF